MKRILLIAIVASALPAIPSRAVDPELAVEEKSRTDPRLPGVAQRQLREDLTLRYALRSLLIEEVQEMLDAGHLLPYFTRRGENHAIWLFTNPGDTVRALSMAYPHLPDARKQAVRAYLKKEMAAYPPCSDKLNSPTDEGAPRQLHELPVKDFEWNAGRLYRQLPRVHNVYSVWLYADATGDWDYVRANWKSIVAFYEKHRADCFNYFGGAGAPTAMARMARRQGKMGEAMIYGAEAKAALEATAYDEAHAAKMMERYGFRPQRQATFHHAGYQYLHLTPEVADYVAGNRKARKAVLEQTARGEHKHPMWHVSQASGFMRCYGESHALSPYVSAAIFPVKVQIEYNFRYSLSHGGRKGRVPPQKLRDWIGAEDAPRGDLFYLERLVLGIQDGRMKTSRDVRKATRADY